MSRLPIQAPETVTGSTKQMFDALRKGFGMVPNMAKVMGNSPAVLGAWLQFETALRGAELSASIRESIALLAAEINGCTYCLSAHTAGGKRVGLTPEQIEDARDGTAPDPKARAALAFARRVIDTRGGIDASDIDDIRTAGFSNAQIAEIVGAVALNLFTNTFNRAFDTDVDFPIVEPRAHAPARARLLTLNHFD